MILLHKKDSSAMLFKDPPIFYSERLSYVQDSLNYYQQKYPKIQKNDKTYYIEKFKDFLFNSTDSLFVRDISKWVDIQNVIDWHIHSIIF
jgi:spore coat protein CotH